MNERKPIKVLVCDDSALIRVVLKNIINKQKDMTVINVASNGKEAIEKAQELKPDVITLDIEMPVMNGLESLRIIVRKKIAPVIMFSSLTKEGAEETLESIELGAFDYITKPSGGESLLKKETEIIEKIRAAALSGIYSKLDIIKKSNIETEKNKVEVIKKEPSEFDFKIVTIGISTGGPKTIFKVLPELPEDLNASVILVQHMPPAFIPSYVARINSKTKLECIESEPGMKIKKGKIYVAKGGYHLKLIKKRTEALIRQTKEPEHLFVPSVDVMMDSVCDVFKSDTIGVLMTGMGWDGAKGMLKIARLGGYTIAESNETAIVFGMPKEAIKKGGVKIVLPHYLIASEIIKAVNGGVNVK